MQRTICVLRDYRDHFYSSVRQVRVGQRLDLLTQEFANRGWGVELKRFADLDFRTENFADRFVLYQSSEDRDLHYKSFIEDVVLALSLQGARLIPRFEFLRAHHNKSFMEMLRQVSHCPALKSLAAKTFGVLEEFADDPLASDAAGPVVIKPAEGCQSQSVQLARTRREKLRAAARVSFSPHLVDDVKDLIKVRVRPYHRKVSRHRRKFIVQPFLPGLDHDYKVLVYGRRLFLLRRNVRPNDFRASGSGRWQWIESPPRSLLELAREVRQALAVPFISLDVAIDGAEHYVFEFQVVYFGTATLEKSPWHFVHEGVDWRRVDGPVLLEGVFAESVVEHIEREWPTPPPA